MELNEALKKLGRDAEIVPEEENIRTVMEMGKDAWFGSQQALSMTYWAFLWSQLRYTRKGWWGLQAALLLLASHIISVMGMEYLGVRSLGVVGSLFVVLMIPELWRNRESDSTQVEAACFYSLRQVYAARITLFGVVDIGLLTFFGLSLGRMGFTLVQIAAQFLLPATVTACICFTLLCGKRNVSEAVSVAACLTWAGVWWLILMNERIYNWVAPPVWTGLLGIAMGILALSVRRAVASTNQYWEEVLI